MRVCVRAAAWVVLIGSGCSGSSAGSPPNAGIPSSGRSAGVSGASAGVAAGARADAGSAGTVVAGRSAGGSGGGVAVSSGAAGVAAAGVSAATAGAAGAAGHAGAAAVGGAGSPAAGGGGGSNAGGASSMQSVVYRVPLRVHMAMSALSDADLTTVLAEMNQVWLTQAGVCFEIDVTDDETNRTDGLDFRYTSGKIPGAASANGLTENAHSIWSIDHPNLGSAPHPIHNPASRTTAHELGHALGLAHENPAPSTDCSSPCYCETLNGDCDDFLMRSGTKGFYLSAPEIDIARKRAAKLAQTDTSIATCGAPLIMP